jgi:large repetitive protein
MRTLNLSVITLVIFFTGFLANTSSAQSVLDPNDPVITYNPAAPPAIPAWYTPAKWVRTRRLNNWNTDSYKAYIYNGFPFRVKFPKTYNHTANDGKKYPMIVFFHGRGEGGSVYDNEYQLLHGGQQFRDKVDNGTFDGFVFAMQTTGGFWGSGNYVLIKEIIDYMVANNKLDPFRVVANGLSSGGAGTWEMLLEQPTYVSAAMPMSANCACYNTPSTINLIKYTPLWIFQGALDPSPTPYTSEQVRDAVLAAGGRYNYTLYPNLAHGTWNAAWAEPGFYPFVNAAHSANPWPLYGRTEFCTAAEINVTLGLTAGYSEYEWRKDGVLIPGATTNNLVVTGAAGIGVYTARLRRGTVWSDWSPTPVEIKLKTATIPPTITVQGLKSRVIPALDGSTSVPLQVPSTYQSYEWQKEGTNTTIGTTNLLSATTPGDYKIRVTEFFGCSTSFSNPFTVVDANGPNKPDAPINLTANALSQTEIRLDWSDNPSPQHNETNFEVYRATAAGGPYTLIGITNADVLTFSSTGLEPGKRYYYKLRAVNNTGASAASNESNTITQSDVQAPAAPSSLVITGNTRNSISLSWTAAIDDIAVTQYDIYVNGVKSYVTASTVFTVYNLQAVQTYNFSVRARDAANNTSPASNQVTGSTVLAGLPYKYYTFTGTWNALPNFTTLTPAATGTMPNVALTPRTQNNNFAFLWEGLINIPVTGIYYFRTNSNEGSRVWLGALNGSASPYNFSSGFIVDNDGLHGTQDRTSVALSLTAGYYPIAIAFYEQSGSESMTISWNTPQQGNNVFVTIPNSAFADVLPPSTVPSSPSNLVATAVSFKRINVSWTDNSNNETGFEIWRSTSQSSGFNTVGNAAANATSFVDTLALNASTTYYYQIRAVGQTGESQFVNGINSPEAVWQLNNDYNDASGNGRTLTQSNTPVFDAGDKQEGSHSITFNGTSQSVTIPASSTFLQNAYTQKTIAFWMKSNNNTGNRVIADIGGSDDGLALRLDGNLLYAGVASNNARNSFSVPYTSTGWNHIALVYNGSTLRLYVNGTEVGSNTSLPFTTITTTTNGSRIGTVNGSNAFNTATGFFSGKIDHFVIYPTALSAANITNLMNNTQVSQSYATTFALPAIPAVPANFVATGVSKSRINLTWDDVSNETGYQVYRSNGNNTNYLLFATLPANTVTFADSGLFANTINYYKVRAFNEGGSSAFTTEDSARTTNSIPVLSAITNQFMRYSTSLQVNVNATDEDPETLTVNVTNLPSFASYVSTGNGTGYINFDNTSTQGVYTNITVTVTDPQGGTAAVSFDLTVNDNYLPSITGGGNVSVNEQQTASINFSAADQNASDVLTWSFTGLPSFATPVITGNDVQINFAPGFADNGPYNITATVNDGNNGSASVSFVVTVNDVNPNRKTYINFTDGSLTSPAPWNNTNKPTPSLNDNFANLLDETGANSGIGLLITSPWQNLGNATNTFGVNTTNNSGIYPDNVMRSAYFTNATPQTIRIYGLNPAYKYNFKFFGSRGGVTDDRTSIYTINGTSVTLNAANNSQNTASLNNMQPAGDGSLVLTLEKGPASSFGYLNAMVIESLFDDGSTPAKPRNLAANVLTNNISLSWVDAAYNENSYQVYRSTNRNGSYTLLNPSANNPNAVQYTDGSVTGNTTYYYYLVAVNNVGSSPSSDTVTATMPNASPVITAIADVQMKTDQTVPVNIVATDSPGDVITLSVTGLPAFATFTNTGNGTGTITIAPGSVMGTFTGITVTATDNFGLSSNRQFSISVSDKNLSYYYVNFNQVLPVAAPWNNFNSAPNAGVVLPALKDEIGATSGINVTLVDAWDGANDVGSSTGNNTGVYPDNVMKTAYFTSVTTAKRIRISGLTVGANTKYNLTFFASRSGVTDDRNTTYSYNGQSVTLNAASNTTNTVQLLGLVPDASGAIEFTATKVSTAAFGYINAMVIQSYIDNGSVLSPTALSVAPKSASTIQLKWTDRSNNEAGFEIYRSSSYSGTYNLVTTTAANATTYLDGGLASGTIYYYKVRGKSATNVYSDYSNIAGASTLQYSVFVNFNQVDPAGAPWNNTNEGPIEGDTYALKNNLNNPTGINMVVVGNIFNGVNPFGMNTGNNSGVYPDNVMRSTWWLDANATARLRIDGLNIANRYNFTFFASRDGGGNSPDRTSVYTINGTSVSLNAINNISNTVQITSVVPDGNGSVMIEIRAGSASPFAYIGALVIESFQPGINGGSGGGGNPFGRVTNNSVVETTQPNTPAGATTNAVATGDTRPVLIAKNWSAEVFPNPFEADPMLSLQMDKGTERITISVTDAAGKQIMMREMRNVPQGAFRQNLGLDAAKLQPGIYFVRVTDAANGNVQTIKLIKTN